MKFFLVSAETKILRFLDVKISRNKMQTWFWYDAEVSPRYIKRRIS